MRSITVLGNSEFAIGMRFSGVGKSHVIKKREDGIGILKALDQEEFIIANVSVVKLLPELNEFRNLVTLPDDLQELDNIEDLKHIIKSAVGIELEVV